MIKSFLIVLALYVSFKLFRAYIHFKELKKESNFYLLKANGEIEDNPKSPLPLYHRGCVYLKIQDFTNARKDFLSALDLMKTGEYDQSTSDLEGRILINIKFTEKPLPWSKNGPKDFSKSWFMYSLINGFGNMRFNF